MNINNIINKINALEIEKRSFINGEYVNSIDMNIINKVSPVDGRDLSGLSACNQGDVNIAVAAAKSSFESKIWCNQSPQEKKQVLYRLADLMLLHHEELALLDTLETGRAFKNYYNDSVPKAIEALRYFAECIDKYYDHAIPPRADAFASITREPLGVVALIMPWNDPMVVSMWKLAPALLMGNSTIVKPAEQSSFSILLVARLAKEAGIPDGVFNVVTGFGETAGKALALHLDISGIFFTGSSEVGKKILQYSGQSNMKKVGLECGGKSPFIVSEKCTDLPKTAKVLAKNMFYNQGQICSAPSRAIVANEIKDKFVELLIRELENYIPNDPFNIESEVGCVVSKEQQHKIQTYIELGIQSGAKKYSSSTAKNMHPNSSYVLPTIFVQENNHSILAQEEIFGPVLLVIGSNSIQESVSIANDSKYGLAASIWSNDSDEAYWVSRQLQAGIVHINSYGDDDNSVPFGGIKESGIGKDKSIYAFDEYSYLKTTWIHYEPINDN
ncbi:MAG: aldehyde dehydrogenase family protein [gamma proteobacterium symbiont of Taylorina sp.]|nr:aldehyde dehydrogenase family protein [gamma proteobacterium symbiont of Taylorina sp.]